MSPSGNLDWVWYGAGVVLALLGLTLAYWSLLHDRARGRRRCPKCWYDMSSPGPDPLTCPECGRTVKREKKLFKTRRRWGWATVAMVLLIGSGATPYWHYIKIHGWPEAAPTNYLIVKLHSEQDQDGTVWKEIIRRANNDLIWTWQWKWIYHQALRLNESREFQSYDWINSYGDLLRIGYKNGHFASDDYQQKLHDIAIRIDLEARSVWPANSPIYLKCSTYNWLIDKGSYLFIIPHSDGLSTHTEYVQDSSYHDLWINTDDIWRDDAFTIGTPNPTENTLSFDVEFRFADESDWMKIPERIPSNLISSTSRTIPIRLKPSITDILNIYKSRDFESLLRNHMRVRIDQSLNLELILDEPLRPDIPDMAEEFTFAFEAELLRNGDPVNTYTAWTSFTFKPDNNIFATDDTIYFFQISPGEEITDQDESFWHAEDWSLRIKSDPIMALRNFDVDVYWDGMVEVPIVRHPYTEQTIVDSAQLSDLLSTSVHVEWSPKREYARLVIDSGSARQFGKIMPLLIDGQIELFIDGESATDVEFVEFIIDEDGTDYTWWASPTGSFSLMWSEEMDERKHEWELRIVSDDDYLGFIDECDCRSIWKGELRIPVDVRILP